MVQVLSAIIEIKPHPWNYFCASYL